MGFERIIVQRSSEYLVCRRIQGPRTLTFNLEQINDGSRKPNYSGFLTSIYASEYPGLSLVFDIEIVEPRLGSVVKELTCV